jgi:hypothetical protein
MNAKSILVIAVALTLAALLAIPASAADGCIVPPDEYFLSDGPINGQSVHDGPQLGQIWWITDKQQKAGFVGNHYLGLTGATYAPGKSHNEQESLAFSRMAYCYSLPDHAYQPNLTDEEYVAASPYGVHVYPAS